MSVRKEKIRSYLHRQKPQDTDTMTDRTNTAPRCGQNDLISGKYSEMRDSVFAYILKKTGDRAEAEDLVQDTFTRLLEYREVICAETVRSFIFRIAEYFASCSPKASDLTDETVRLDEILEIEQKCIRKMGKRKGEIYLLYIHKGKTSKEISDMLNLSRRTVENHIFAARKIVREGLREAAG